MKDAPIGQLRAYLIYYLEEERLKRWEWEEAFLFRFRIIEGWGAHLEEAGDFQLMQLCPYYIHPVHDYLFIYRRVWKLWLTLLLMIPIIIAYRQDEPGIPDGVFNL